MEPLRNQSTERVFHVGFIIIIIIIIVKCKILVVMIIVKCKESLIENSHQSGTI